MATIRDVARISRVSLSTVSRVARGEGAVNETTRQAVLKAMAEVGYQPNQAARTLRNSRSKIIGVIVSDVENFFYSLVVSRMEREIKRNDYTMLLSYSNENAEEEKNCLNLMMRARVDGLIYTPVDIKNKDQINIMQDQGIKVLQIYRKAFIDIDSVIVDDVHGIYMATQHLLSQGHRRILLLDVASNIPPSRADGFRRALAEQMMECPQESILNLPLKGENVRTILRQLREFNPTAVIAGTNTFGYDAVQACKILGMSIPKDISVVVQDDISWVPLMEFTAISQPMEKIAVTAVDMLLRRLYTKDKEEPLYIGRPVHIEVEPSVIKRNSVTLL